MCTYGTPAASSLSLRCSQRVGLDRDREVVQPAEHLGVRAEVEPGEVEERERVAVADVEEEVRRAAVVAVLEHLGERELEQALVEVDRPLDVAAEQRDVVHAPRGRGRTVRSLVQMALADLVALARRLVARLALEARLGLACAWSCGHPDQHLGAVRASGQLRFARARPVGPRRRRRARRRLRGRPRLRRRTGGRSAVGHRHRLARLQPPAPQHGVALADRDGGVVALAGRDRLEPALVELGVDVASARSRDRCARCRAAPTSGRSARPRSRDGFISECQMPVPALMRCARPG